MTDISPPGVAPRQTRGTGTLRRIILMASCAVLLIGTSPAPLQAQEAPAPQEADQQGGVEAYSPQQLDALLAPIALYPDQLLTQILMASTYPLQVVEAQRWAADPANRGLSGDALAQALAPQNWDPSVKSLVPFPQVLAMMNGKLDWMQQLGYAMGTQQAEVMDSVQRLRQQAQNAGQLQSNAQCVVSREGPAIVIAPAQPNVVYVPTYNPAVVYGAWAYPDYPPVYLPPPPGYYYGNALAAGLAFGAGVAITGALWGWARPNWGRRDVFINVNHYNIINIHRPPIREGGWHPGGGWNRPGGGFRPPIGPVGRPGGGFRPGIHPIGNPGNRPGFGPGHRPEIGGGNRPGFGGGNRPEIGGGNRPGTGQGSRPGTGPSNRPETGLPHRPEAGGGARPPTNGGHRPGGMPGGSIGRPGGQPSPGNRPGGGGVERPVSRPPSVSPGGRPPGGFPGGRPPGGNPGFHPGGGSPGFGQGGRPGGAPPSMGRPGGQFGGGGMGGGNRPPPSRPAPAPAPRQAPAGGGGHPDRPHRG